MEALTPRKVFDPGRNVLGDTSAEPVRLIRRGSSIERQEPGLALLDGVYQLSGERCHSEVACETLEMLDSLCEVLCSVYGHRPASLREGEFSLNGVDVKMFSVLFDSGALHHSYISEDLVERHRAEWASSIKPYKSWVKLADQKTVIQTKEMVTGRVSFVSDSGQEYSGEVDCIVWKMKGLDFILGLPDIVKSFMAFFFLILQQYQCDNLLSLREESDMQLGEVRQ